MTTGSPPVWLTIAAAICSCSPSADRGAHTLTQAPQVAGWSVGSRPLVEVVPPSPSEFFKVTAAVRLEDGRIVVADAGPRVLLFDGQGRYVRSLGRRGQGPGEFQSVEWIQPYAGDSVLAYDRVLGRATVLAAGHGFVRAFTPQSPRTGDTRPALLGVFADGSLLGSTRLLAKASRSTTGFVRPLEIFYRYNRDGSPIDSLGNAFGDEVATSQGIVVRPPFLHKTFVAAGGSTFALTTSDSFDIQLFPINGGVPIAIREPAKLSPVSESDLQVLAQTGIQAAATPTYPAVSNLLLDLTGDAWVRPYAKPATAEPRGRYLG